MFKQIKNRIFNRKVNKALDQLAKEAGNMPRINLDTIEDDEPMSVRILSELEAADIEKEIDEAIRKLSQQIGAMPAIR